MVQLLVWAFPPHTRGCTQRESHPHLSRDVSPAHAGMYLSTTSTTTSGMSFPRTRGDVPVVVLQYDQCLLFPPHTRGCTLGVSRLKAETSVSPAHAGMYLDKRRPVPRKTRFPRTRGDVPEGEIRQASLEMFPPHTRGCTFGTTPQVWLNLQKTYELRRAEIKAGHQIAERVRPRQTAA